MRPRRRLVRRQRGRKDSAMILMRILLQRQHRSRLLCQSLQHPLCSNPHRMVFHLGLKATTAVALRELVTRKWSA
jgi:hypothetical protein